MGRLDIDLGSAIPLGPRAITSIDAGGVALSNPFRSQQFFFGGCQPGHDEVCLLENPIWRQARRKMRLTPPP